MLSDLRNRSLDGFWTEDGIKWHLGKDWRFESVIEFGRDSGTHHGLDFTANSHGLKLDILRFIGAKGRIQSNLEWLEISSSGSTSLPPEAMKGLPVGRSIRAMITGQILLGTNLSVNANFNYLSNQRYRDLISFTGELRAYF